MSAFHVTDGKIVAADAPIPVGAHHPNVEVLREEAKWRKWERRNWATREQTRTERPDLPSKTHPSFSM